MRRGLLLFVALLLVALVVVVAFVRIGRTNAAHRAAESHESSLTPLTLASIMASAKVAPPPGVPLRAAWLAPSAAPIELAGRVFVDGKPARGAEIVVRDELTSEGLLAVVHSTSDDEGRFSVRVPRIVGWYRLVAEKNDAGLAPAWAVVPGDARKDDVELRLEACRARVYGVVADASGGAIAGARIALDRAPTHATTSDARGHFDLCMPPRFAKLRVEAQGYGPWTKTLSARGAERQDVTLMPEASVAGVVVSSTSSAPIPLALVSLRANGEAMREAQADEEGRFEMTRIAPGPYTIEARALGKKSHHPVDVAVFASARANVTVPVDERVRVRGRVLANGVAVPRATVNVGFHATFEWASAVRTDDAGAFSIDDAPVGNLFVKVDDYEIEAPRVLAVAERGLDGVVVNVRAKGELAVTVTRDGEPVRDANVQLRGAGSDSKTTSSTGIATFRGLAAGRYRIVAEHESDFGVVEGVDIAAEQSGKARVELASGRQVVGHVHDERGRPVDGARITLTPTSSTADMGASAISGDDGAFRGGPLRGPATYRVRVTRSGIELEPKGEHPRLVVPERGAVAPSDLALVVRTHDEDLSGVVVDSASGPVRDARVIVTRPERHSDVLATTFTGNDGTFAFHGLGRGPYAIKAITAAGSEAEQKPLALPLAAPVRLVMPEVGSIEGTLEGFTRTPSVMAWSVAGYEWDFHPAVLETRDSVRRFSIGGLARGRYHVAASTPDAAAQATIDVTGTGAATIALVASKQRTVRARVLDFRSERPLPNLRCQAAPDLGDTRSPVVVPGVFFSGEDGALSLADVPASPLYMWCVGEGEIRGGVARVPTEVPPDGVVTVWGLDVRGKPSLDVRALGMTLADDHPFSRRIVAVEPKGIADRGGLHVADVLVKVGDRSVEELGNGTARSYLALILTEQKRVPVVVLRGEVATPRVLSVE